ncbi:hypothetical protein [Alkaliphilus sp. B6464]|uniref:hypothetical protein n=1 Tax=Alkaliphilus sp. B6464 TaxID=2731219 RepID=UPI001BA485E9|nr:hypothetical protein [Alkaliphilus sp. B6464]QUH21447.1 hypothetical protein HYG84_17195 [Alkaliphilus sp. B6464]
MNLSDETKLFIERSVKRFYVKAIEAGAVISPVTDIGMNLYKVSVGNMELTYMGTVEGTAKVIASSGNIF